MRSRSCCWQRRSRPQDDAVGATQPDGAWAAGGQRGGGVAAPDELQLAQRWRRRTARDGRRRRHALCPVALLVPCVAPHPVWGQWAAWGCLQCLLFAQPAVVWEWGTYAGTRVNARWWDADGKSPAERRGDGWWRRFHWCGRLGSFVVPVFLAG